MSSAIRNDLATLEKMIRRLGLNPDAESVVDAMDIWWSSDFPAGLYVDQDEINDRICEFLDPWIKASGEVVGEDGKPASFTSDELPQPDSQEWRHKFRENLVLFAG